MENVVKNIYNPLEIRTIGIEALKDALGLVGMIKFMQQYNPGYGDYTAERLDEPDMTLDEIERELAKLSL